MKKLERLKKTDNVYSSSDDLHGSLDKIIQHLLSIKEKYPNHSDFRLVTDAGHNNISVDIYADRYETDEEFKEREKLVLAREAKEKEAKRLLKIKKEEEEKATFERLKKKFEPKVV